MQYKKKKQYRLKGYDYSQHGAYFITICTKNKQDFFGSVIKGKMKLNSVGHFTKNSWEEIPEKFKNAILDEFVVMPNHIHGIIILDNENALCNENAPRRVL